MRSLSLATRQALMAQETGEVFLFLVALSHPSMITMRFVNNQVDIVSAGETYMAFPFDLTIPDDSADELPRVQLAIDNVDRRIVEAVRTIFSPATLTLKVIRAAEPDVAVAGPYVCALRNVGYNAMTVTGDLWPFEDVNNEIFPQHAFDPAHFTGLFA